MAESSQALTFAGGSFAVVSIGVQFTARKMRN